MPCQEARQILTLRKLEFEWNMFLSTESDFCHHKINLRLKRKRFYDALSPHSPYLLEGEEEQAQHTKQTPALFADCQNRARVSGSVRLRTSQASRGSQSIMVIPTVKTVNTEDRQDRCEHNAPSVYKRKSRIKWERWRRGMMEWEIEVERTAR